MGLFGRKIDLTALPLDWLPLVTLAAESYRRYEQAERTGADGGDAIEALLDAAPKEQVLSAAVHWRRLWDAAADVQVARALREHPFRDWVTPWDAEHLTQIPMRAITSALVEGSDDPARSAAALRHMVGSSLRLAAFAEPESVSEAAHERWSGVFFLVLRLSNAAYKRYPNGTKPKVWEYFRGAALPNIAELDFPGAPSDWHDNVWRWNRQHNPIEGLGGSLGEVDEQSVEDLAPHADRLRLSGRANAAFRYMGTNVPAEDRAHEWLEWVGDTIDDVATELQARMRQREIPSVTGNPLDAVLLDEPWTTRPWQRIKLEVVVVPGGDVRVVTHDLPERSFRVLLPVDPARLVPAEELVLAYAKVFAEVLLHEIEDLTEHAREVLTAEVVGSEVTRELVLTAVNDNIQGL